MIMRPRKVASLQYLMMPQNTGPYIHPNHYLMYEYQMNGCSNTLYNFQTPHEAQELSPPSSCFSNNSSTSDETEEQQRCLIDERRQRRMISNRESARRSRMRKQKHVDELWSQVVWLRKENHQLIEKLNHLSERHGKVLQENNQLKGETSELREMLSDMQLPSPYSALRDIEGVVCDAAFLKAESSEP